jgi:uncharacterized protein YeaO (DUF488 family)
MHIRPLAIPLKRAYEKPEAIDGVRVLVDCIWPHGLSKERAQIDLWLKEIAPSNELLTWFGHDPEKFGEFRHRYEVELASGAHKEALAKLRDVISQGYVTLVFAAHDSEHSNATVRRDVLLRGDCNIDALANTYHSFKSKESACELLS